MIVGGPLCESGDIFTQEEGGFVCTRRLPEAAVGDLLVIECAGAYGFVMGSNYNSRPLAAEVLVQDGQAAPDPPPADVRGPGPRRVHSRAIRIGEGVSGGLSQFGHHARRGRDENGTVPFGCATVIVSPILRSDEVFDPKMSYVRRIQTMCNRLRPMTATWLVLPLVIFTAAIATVRGEPTKGKSMSYGEVRAFLGQAHEAGRIDQRRRGPRGRLPGVAGPRDDLDLRRPGRPELRLHQPRLHSARASPIRTSTTTAARNACGSRPRAGSSASGSSRAQKQTLDDWYTPPAFNEGAWKVVSGPRDPFYRMAAPMKFQNASATQFDLDVTRDVRLLAATDDRASCSASRRPSAIGRKGVKIGGLRNGQPADQPRRRHDQGERAWSRSGCWACSTPARRP